MIPYFNLHLHSEYSNLRMLDCINKLEQIVEKCEELGLGGFALTDHEALCGHVKAIQLQKKLKEQESSIRIFLGNEIYLVDSLEDVQSNYKSGVTNFFHFILIAKDAKGHEQLRKLSSKAWENSFYTGKMERVPTVKSELEEIIGEDKGHLIFSTACIGSEIAWWILQDKPDKCYEFIEWCQKVALPENFYLEMQPSDSPEQVRVNQMLTYIGKKLGIKRIITTDAHYLSADQAKVHEAFLNSREDESREALEFYRSCYLMDSNEIHNWMDKQIGFNEVEKALNNTIEIANKIEFFDLECPTIVPDAVIPEFSIKNIFKEYYGQYPSFQKYQNSSNIYDRYLLKLIEDGYEKRIAPKHFTKEKTNEYIERISIELDEMWKVTEKLGTSISAYYIVTLDLVNTMWDEGNSIVGVARGSVTGMLTMYLVGITQIDPMIYNLKHWRHISASKVELSDVDLDSAASKRGQIIEAIKEKRGYDKVLNCCTFKSEGPKSAILTSCRGLNIPVEEAQYMASLIPVTRGFVWSIEDCIYGNKEEEREVVKELVQEINKYDGLLQTILTIEGLIVGRSVHASAVYLYNNNYIEHNAMMKAPNGIHTTQFNMKDSDYCSGLKMDLLTVEAIDKIQLCMELLIKKGYIKWQGSLRQTYEKYLHPDVLDYDSPKMWDMVGNGEITNLFQFDTNVGKQAILKIKPRNLVDLATSSTIMRLMISEKDAEQPIDTYVRYKNHIEDWYECMKKKYHLTEDEIKTLEKYLLSSYGLGPTQEDVMQITMDEKIADFSVKESNLIRKGISKKDKNLQHKMKEMFFEKGKEHGASDNILNYVWKEVVGKQLGYSFSINHTTPYAVISLQEMNLAYHYPIEFWITSCLSVNAGAGNETNEDNKASAYGKMSVAICEMQHQGIKIIPPSINRSEFGFDPDMDNKGVLFGLKGMNGIGDDICNQIISHRPYYSLSDFCNKLLDTKIVKPTQMMQLIKGGSFDEFDLSRKRVMEEYLRSYVFEPCASLTLSQLRKIEELNILPEDIKICVRYLKYKDYVLDEEGWVEDIIIPDKKIPKSGYHDRLFVLDENSQSFFVEHFSEDSVVRVDGQYYVISEKKFSKEVDKLIQPLRDWMSKEETLKEYNNKLFQQLWNDKCQGTEAAWAMQSLSYYDKEHELKGIQNIRYGIVDFFNLPEEPIAYEHYTRFIDGERKELPKYNITRIAGCVLNADNLHHTVTILTTTGVVNCKFSKEQYAFYNRRISSVKQNNEKTVIENSWFKRGNLIVIAGFRRGEDNFVPKVYKDTVWNHTVNLITTVNPDGTLDLQLERTKI